MKPVTWHVISRQFRFVQRLTFRPFHPASLANSKIYHRRRRRFSPKLRREISTEQWRRVRSSVDHHTPFAPSPVRDLDGRDRVGLTRVRTRPRNFVPKLCRTKSYCLKTEAERDPGEKWTNDKRVLGDPAHLIFLLVSGPCFTFPVFKIRRNTHLKWRRSFRGRPHLIFPHFKFEWSTSIWYDWSSSANLPLDPTKSSCRARYNGRSFGKGWNG